ncbi:MAG: DUF1501 domain-containing protein [Candidatus Manganitrophaceae bacterium]
MEKRSRTTLVCIFLRGGMDGLMAVTPYTDPALPQLRPKLMLPPPGSNSERALLRLDDRFGLHPSFAPLLPFFQEGRMAIVHGVGSPEGTRSHFDQQEYIETGTPGVKGTRSGWLNRALASNGQGERSPFRAIAMGLTLPRALYGDETALAISDLATFGLRRSGQHEAVYHRLEEQYRSLSNDVLRRVSVESFAAEAMVGICKGDAGRSASESGYPPCPIGTRLHQVAGMIKADIGVKIAWVDYATADWDTHANQHGVRGAFSRYAGDLSQSLAAFYADLGDRRDDAVVMTMTEFGRTVAQNGSCGTDHGRASCFFIIGRMVQGGRVYGDVPTLSPDDLEDGRDLPVTTDFRAVFAEVAAQQLGVSDAKMLFPGWTGLRMRLFKRD